MKHLKNLVNESMSLTVFEMLNMLQGFLQEKYGIKTFGAKRDNGFIMYMSKYVTDEGEDKDLSEAIKAFVEKECSLENVTVHKDKYGYHIEFGHNKQSAKLVETTQAQGTGMADAKVTYKCAFCDEEHEGFGNDPWPVDMHLEHRVCDNCNSEIVIPARLEMLKNKNRNEATDRKDVEASASNTVLDNKFTWLFNVLDKNGNDLEEGIEYLQDAIDLLIKDDAAFLVAFPYIDPKPNDPNVELVFADNPGPVVIYNNEEATVAKGSLERPTSETQPKDQEEAPEETEEEQVEEAMTEDKDKERRIKRQMADLRDKNKEINKGRMTGSVHKNKKRIEELENQLRRLRMQKGSMTEAASEDDYYLLVYQGYDGMAGPIYKDEFSTTYFEDINGQHPYSERAAIAILSPKNDPDGEPNYVLNRDSYEFADAGYAEAVLDQYVVKVHDIVLPGIKVDGNDEFTFTTKDIAGIKFQVEQEIVQRYGVSMDDIESYEWEVDRREELLESMNDDDEYVVNIDLLNEFYQTYTDDDVEPLTAIRRLKNDIEEMLFENDLYMGFEYVGQRSVDLQSSVEDRRTCQRAKQLIESFYGDIMEVTVTRRPF